MLDMSVNGDRYCVEDHGSSIARRTAAGDPPVADSADAGDRLESRVCDCPPYPANLQIRAACRARISLPGIAPHGTRRIDRVVLGHDREQPESEVLPADAPRQASVG